MEKYKVIEGFIDEIEKKAYRANDPFVIGPKTDKKRLEALLTKNNKQNRPLIEKVKVLKVKQEE